MCRAFRSPTGNFPAEAGPVDLRRRSTFVGLASSGPMHRLSRVDTAERRNSTSTGPPPVTVTHVAPFARRFSVASTVGISEKDLTADLSPTPPPPASQTILAQRKMSSPTPKIPESLFTKKRVTQNKEKRDSL